MFWRSASAPALLFLVGCQMPQLPGEEVGRYAISGELIENTCGREALPANDPLEFDVQLRSEESRGYWLTQPPAIPGRLSSDGEFVFRFDSAVDVQDPDAPMPRLQEPEDFTDPSRFDPAVDEVLCRLRVDEEIRGRVLRSAEPMGHVHAADAGPMDFDLVGENEIEIRALSGSGSDCDRLVASQGGPFAELPCRVRYEITGELTGG